MVWGEIKGEAGSYELELANLADLFSIVKIIPIVITSDYCRE